MNLHMLKQRCEEAAEIMIREHGYDRDDFKLSDGDETVSAPRNMESCFVEHGFLHPGPLKGTTLLWFRCHEHDCWDFKLPSEVLDEIEYWSKLTPEEAEAMICVNGGV